MLFGKKRVKKSLIESGPHSTLKKYGKKSVDPLLSIMKDDDDLEIRKLSAETLDVIGHNFTDKQRIDYLIATQKYSELGKIGEDGVNALISIVCKRNWDTREAAASALVELGGVTTDRLISLLKNNDLGVRKVTSVSLEKLGYAPKSDSEKMIYLLGNQEWDQVIRKIPLKAVVSYVKEECSEVRHRIVRSIFKAERSFLQFIELLECGDDSVRDGVVVMLSELNYKHIPHKDYKGFGKRILELVIDDNKEKNVRLAVLKILSGGIGVPGADSILQDLIHDAQDKGVREAAHDTKHLIVVKQAAWGLVVRLIDLRNWIAERETVGSRLKFLEGLTKDMPNMTDVWQHVFSYKSEYSDTDPNIIRNAAILSCPYDGKMIPTLRKIMMTDDDEKTKKYAAIKLYAIGYYPSSREEWNVFVNAQKYEN